MKTAEEWVKSQLSVGKLCEVCGLPASGGCADIEYGKPMIGEDGVFWPVVKSAGVHYFCASHNRVGKVGA